MNVLVYVNYVAAPMGHSLGKKYRITKNRVDIMKHTNK